MADRPIYLRQHLLAVHDKAVEALESKEKRLVSLVGCPGTGKTWCGWLVAYTLHKEKKKKVLHVTIRGKVVTVVQNFDTKKVYEDVDAWKSTMLKQLLTESKCDVCIIDVGEKTPDKVNDIFEGVRSILELGSFPDVKFFGMVSGHGEENIVGKQFNIQALTQKMVLWSWSQQEFRGYCELFNIGKDDSDKLKEEVYDTCGGSIRGCFAVDQVKQEISTALGNLNEKATGRFLLEVKRSTTDGGSTLQTIGLLPEPRRSFFCTGHCLCEDRSEVSLRHTLGPRRDHIQSQHPERHVRADASSQSRGSRHCFRDACAQLLEFGQVGCDIGFAPERGSIRLRQHPSLSELPAGEQRPHRELRQEGRFF